MNEKIENYFTLTPTSNILLIVNSSTSKLEKMANEIVSQYELPRISLNKELTQILSAELRQTRGSKAIEWIRTKSNEVEEHILFSDINIIFEPNLEIDPLALFKQISRHKKIIVLWPGNYSNNDLNYATPEHTHFRRWGNPGVEIIQL